MARPPRSPWPARPDVSSLVVIAWLIGASPVFAGQIGQPTDIAQALRLGPDLQDASGRLDTQDLFLEVFQGDRPTGLITRIQLREGRLAAGAADLRAIGLALPPGIVASDADLVGLDTLPGLAYRYEPLTQRLYLQVPSSLRPVQALGYRAPEVVEVTRDSGMLARYDVYGRTAADRYDVSLGHTLRWFSPIGAIETEALAEQRGNATQYRRVNSFWTYSDPRRLWTWTAGDLITGGLSWTRPVRLAGVQWRRNFGVRPDLITQPMPRFSSSAAVPSTVELYVNNVRHFGGEVQDGPFVLDAMPRIEGAGQASLVVTDSLGRVTQTTVPLYVDHVRLAPGLIDFSVEAGVLRRGFGAADEYEREPVVSGSLRRGMTERVTMEAHVEAGAGAATLGTGAVWSPGYRWGLLTGSASFDGAGRRGGQYSVGYQRNARRFGVDLQFLLRDAGFSDLGETRGRPGFDSTIREQQRATVWTTLGRGSLGVSWFEWETQGLERHRLASLSWQMQFGRVATSASFFDDRRGGRGGGVTLTLPIGTRTAVSTSVRGGAHGTSSSLAIRRDAPYEGGWGWSAQAGEERGAEALLGAEFRGRYGEVRAGFTRQAGVTGSFVSGSGSVAMMDRRLFFSRRIDDAFAVVSTSGTAGVPVLSENRLFGETNSSGYLLVPQLRGWQRNRLAIDPDTLGSAVQLGAVQQVATPADRGGVLVHFGLTRVTPAIVTLLGPTGAPVPAGTRARIASTGERLPVGFDGEAYLQDTTRTVTLELRVGDVGCRYTVAARSSLDARALRREIIPCEVIAR